MNSASYNVGQLKDKFDLDGFVAIPGFLRDDELAGVKNQLDRYISQCVPEIPRADVYYENLGDTATLKQLSQIGLHDSYFASLIRHPKWSRLAETLLGDKVAPQDLEWFNKPPHIGKLTPPHQDGYYFMLEPNEALTMWLALDSVDESNGCIRYVAGSHRKGLRPHARTSVLGFSQGITNFGPEDRSAEVSVPARPGDLLVHHSLTIHRADGNPTQRHRRSLGLVYYAQRARQDVERLAAYQKQLDDELLASGKI